MTIAPPPLVSVLIPTWNRPAMTVEAVRAAMAQTLRDIEIVVVDNASTDNTWDVLQPLAVEDPRVRLIRQDTNVGILHNWKRALDEARAPYVKILWSDDLMSPTFLEQAVPMLASGPEVGFVFSTVQMIDEAGKGSTFMYQHGDSGTRPIQDYLRAALSWSWKMPNSPGCALFRTEDLRQCMVMDVPNAIGSDYTKHGIGSDLLVFLNFAARYPKFGYLSEPLNQFRAHQGSVSIYEENIRLECLYRVAATFFACTTGPQVLDDEETWRFIQGLHLFLSYRGAEAAKIGIVSLHDFFPSRGHFEQVMTRVAGHLRGQLQTVESMLGKTDPLHPPRAADDAHAAGSVENALGFRQLIRHPKKFLGGLLGHDRNVNGN